MSNPILQDLKDLGYTPGLSVADIKRLVAPVFTKHGRTVPSYLGSVSASSKIVKSEKLDLYTYIIYLAPSNMSGVGNVCPSASAGCRAACLYNSGRSAMDSGINFSRITKTLLWYGNRSLFLRWAELEIDAAHRKYGDKLSVRLNGTSDLSPYQFGNPDVPNIIKTRSHVRFYDYTKVPSRISHKIFEDFPNYHLTWSWADGQDWREVKSMAEEHQLGIAVPFAQISSGKMRVKRKSLLPSAYQDLDVFDGDETDLRFLDRKLGAPKHGAYIVGLRAKLTKSEFESQAIKSGFFITEY